ncbi:MAG TPA: 5-formyltetrahydrofolate cyclo-ligase [Kribbellaceae bacterium]
MQPSKRELRRELLAARRALSAADRENAAGDLVTTAAAQPLISAARSVAVYAAIPPEPDTAPLIAWFTGRGVRVLLPVLHDDNDLGWGEPGARLVTGRFGLSEPAIDLGTGAIRDADLVLCPALAVDRRGVRLGRGGGSYDRALARVPVSTPVVAVLYDAELVDALPADPHDRHVTHVLTPARLIAL